jgi:hypothetical protein
MSRIQRQPYGKINNDIKLYFVRFLPYVADIACDSFGVPKQ